MKRLAYLAGLGLFFSIGCVDSFDVVNDSAPDKDRVITTPADVENLIAGGYRTFWLATEDWNGPNGLSVLADENTSSWGNAGMKDLSSEPRVAFDNSTAYGSIAHVETPWFRSYGGIAAVNDGLRAINDGLEIGEDGEDTDRIVAFAKFTQGVAYGFLGSMFDQAYIIDETIDLGDLAADPSLVPLSPYADVIAAAIGYLEASISTAAGAASFTTPDSWVNELPMTNAELIEAAHSYIARFTAQVARTPAERAAVSWADVKTHALLGVQDGGSLAYFGPTGDGYISWFSDWRWITAHPGWTRSDYKTVGLTDNSGEYTNWLNTAVANRVQFDMTADDRRVTGVLFDDDGTLFEYAGGAPFPISRGSYHFSKYASIKWRAYQATEAEPMPTVTVQEMDLLIAEAEYRMGTMGAAATLVNKSRVANGMLPALDGSESDFFMWLKYEKKIETYANASGLAYFDRRGWTGYANTGQVTDLVEGTPIHFPGPAKEMEIGLMESYTFGGVGLDGSIPKSARERLARRTMK